MEQAFASGVLASIGRKPVFLNSDFYGTSKRVSSPVVSSNKDSIHTVMKAAVLESPPPTFAKKKNHIAFFADPLGRTQRVSLLDNHPARFHLRVEEDEIPAEKKEAVTAVEKKPSPKTTKAVPVKDEQASSDLYSKAEAFDFNWWLEKTDEPGWWRQVDEELLTVVDAATRIRYATKRPRDLPGTDSFDYMMLCHGIRPLTGRKFPYNTYWHS